MSWRAWGTTGGFSPAPARRRRTGGAGAPAPPRGGGGEALVAVGLFALGGFIRGGMGSFTLARLRSEPINRVSGEIATMTNAREFGRTLELTGSSRELDALTAAFNDLMRGLSA